MKPMKIIPTVLLVIVAVPVVAVIAGQLGAFRGRAPDSLGVRDGRLAPPARTPNSVTSQPDSAASRSPGYDPRIAPLRFAGDPAAAMQKLADLVAATEGTQIITRQPDYLYAQATTRLMKFIDDVEFYLDAPAGLIQVRSASRVGKGDMGVNRARIEALRARFETGLR